MINIVRLDGLNCPHLCCDHCGHPIQGKGLGKEGMECYDPKDASGRVWHVHKGSCDQQLNHGKVIFWHDADVGLVYLRNNLKLSKKEWKDAEGRAVLMSEV